MWTPNYEEVKSTVTKTKNKVIYAEVRSFLIFVY